MKNKLPRLGAILGLFMLGGCCVLAHPEPMTVYLRDASTKAPIVGATVEAEPRIGFNPFVPGSCRVSDIGRTQQNGSVRLTVTQGYKVSIIVTGSGYPRVWVDVQHPADAGDIDWTNTVLDRDWAAPSPIEIKAQK